MSSDLTINDYYYDDYKAGKAHAMTEYMKLATGATKIQSRGAIPGHLGV
jgi:hypothetical protein